MYLSSRTVLSHYETPADAEPTCGVDIGSTTNDEAVGFSPKYIYIHKHCTHVEISVLA